MNEVSKTHYRKVFKSDHLGQADLEDFIESGSNLIFTIHHVSQEMGAKVAGKKINANIAYFHEKGIKPLVLNATNSKTLRQLTGSSFVEDWQNVSVQLYIDPNVKMKGDTVGGVRISPKAVKVKQVLTRENVKMWNNAIASYKEHSNFNKVLERVNMSNEDMQFIVDEVAAGNV
jgi:hypothetical protein